MTSQLTLSQAAQFLNVSEKSIRRYIKAKRLPAILVKGKKGYEYRIKKSDLKNFVKPPRGKKAHKKKTVEILSSVSQTEKKEKPSSLKEIMEKTAEKITLFQQSGQGMIDYKFLYEKLLTKYEQSLVMIGSLEAQLTAHNKILVEEYNKKIKKLEETLAKQEKLIWELYQIIQAYKKEEH